MEFEKVLTLVVIVHYIQCAQAFFNPKLLVVTGWPYENGIHSEVIDLEHEGSTCQDLANAPYDMGFGTGSFIQKEVMICGGFRDYYDGSGSTYFNKCWILGQDKNITMKYERADASSIVINDRVSTTYFLK